MSINIYDETDNAFYTVNFDLKFGYVKDRGNKYYIEISTNKKRENGEFFPIYYVFGFSDTPDNTKASSLSDLCTRWLQYIFGYEILFNPSSFIDEGNIGSMLVG